MFERHAPDVADFADRAKENLPLWLPPGREPLLADEA